MLKAADNLMVVQPVKLSGLRVIETLKAFRAKIEPYHLFGLMYVLIALTMTASENEGVMGWFYTQTNIQADIPAIMFALGGLGFLFNPGKRVFTLCLIPLLVYLIIATVFVISSSRFSLTTTWFVIALVLFMWILHFKRLWHFDVRHVFAMANMMLGITILLHPDRGTAAWVHEKWLWLPTELFGLQLIGAACIFPFCGKDANLFVFGAIPINVYAGASLMFSSGAAGPVASAITGMTLMCVLWITLKATDYLKAAEPVAEAV